jgi:hypothetical protein
MFPIVHNVNQLIASVNVLKCDVQRLKAARNASLDEDGNPAASAHEGTDAAMAKMRLEIKDVDKVATDVSRTVSEMKRYVDAIKVDVERSVSMNETTVLRKCEVALNRMVQDRIAVALDRERGHTQDRIASEVADAVREEMEARSKRFSLAGSSPFADPIVQQQVLHELRDPPSPATTHAPASASAPDAGDAANDNDDGSYEIKLKSPNRKRGGGAAHSRVKKLATI